jgi:gamma-glutamyltranspeptidase/glutathione hydrolase
MSTGIGGDAFAIVYRDGEPVGLDAAGPAPAEVSTPHPVEISGPSSVTVPGAVAGWAALAERYGRLGLDTCLQPAIDIADTGFALAGHTARYWSEVDGPDAPRPGQIVASPEQAATLRLIAEEGPAAIYRGPIAAKIASASWLSESDLAAYAPRWTVPLSYEFRGLRVAEIPPPSQGVAALEALALIEQLGDTLLDRVQAVSLALEDAFEFVRDEADVGFLLEADRVRARARSAARGASEPSGGTVYLCAVDEDGMAVSFIQSLFASFGSGVLVPDTGIWLNNRGACFAVGGQVQAGQRPYHTLMPGLLTDRELSLIGPFGVMGGFIQAQAHVQFLCAALDQDLDPQAGLDSPRFRVEGREVHLEPPLWDQADAIRRIGFTPVLGQDVSRFGGGQAIFTRSGVLIGGSDARKDGCALGL